MHQHVAHPPGPEASGVIDTISDTLLNAFSRVRKPDERFLSMRESVDKFEEGLSQSERLWTRVRNRTNGESVFSPNAHFGLAFVCECLRLKEMAVRNPEKISRAIITTLPSLCRVWGSWNQESQTRSITSRIRCWSSRLSYGTP